MKTPSIANCSNLLFVGGEKCFAERVYLNMVKIYCKAEKKKEMA